MRLQARDHVPALTTILTAGSLALVFGAVLEAIPATVLPRAPVAFLAAIPHLNAAISVVALGVVGRGWLAVRSGNVDRHRRSMLAGLVLFAAFLVLYLYRIVLSGPTHFAGPAVVERFVYLPVLAIHMVLAIVCIPLLYYVLLLAVTRPRSELPATAHPRIGRIAVTLWLTSFALGVVVYLLLYVLF
ncbi:MAG: DUF420 domain-containing protein [Haloarculaceae archaeon]